jgi:hypothetical protein
MAHQGRTTLSLITNNFKIKSKKEGIIYTYKVDFIDAEQRGRGGIIQGMENLEEEKDVIMSESMDVFSPSSNLETFQKFKIMNAHAPQLKKIFL